MIEAPPSKASLSGLGPGRFNWTLLLSTCRARTSVISLKLPTRGACVVAPEGAGARSASLNLVLACLLGTARGPRARALQPARTSLGHLGWAFGSRQVAHCPTPRDGLRCGLGGRARNPDAAGLCARWLPALAPDLAPGGPAHGNPHPHPGRDRPTHRHRRCARRTHARRSRFARRCHRRHLHAPHPVHRQYADRFPPSG